MPDFATLDALIAKTIDPAAIDVDRLARFPRPAIEALAAAGWLGLVSRREAGGQGGSLADASRVVERIAQSCPSTAMVVTMHYCATAVIEKHGPAPVCHDIAAGRHLTTLAFSEAGSRSHFWAPIGRATRSGERVALDADKSWVTSAGEADSYVWSSKPLEGDGASTIWLVASKTPNLTIGEAYDGTGLRGNASSPVKAAEVSIAADRMLGADGGGFDIMMGVVLPWFVVLSASCSLGLMEGALRRAIGHVSGTRYAHLGTSIADFPTVRAYLARARIRTDATRALLADTLQAIAEPRDETMLRVLEIKAAAAEAALEVTDVAMRVCGGAAYRKENGVERFFRDARAASVMAPTSDALYDFIGKAICGLPVFG
jgi:alkylation response protein AidB-like acyl-CoA dehydrogenase